MDVHIGDACCSSETVSFHFVKDALAMRVLHAHAYYST
jgi:hypothetical protein